MFVLAPFFLLMSGCEPLSTSWDPVEELVGYPYEQTAEQLITPAASPSQLRVLTWNMKFGGGRINFFFDGFDDRVHMTESEVNANLEGIYALINEQDPDIVLAQEVDRASKRSAYVDMVAAVLNHTDMNYAVWVPNWKSRFPPQEGLGPVEAGQAVFSKYPLVGNTRVDLPQSPESSAVVNYFWLHRALQKTQVDVDGFGLITVHNQHPTAYALDGTKEVHMKMIVDEALAVSGPYILGGDFNVAPPGTKRLDNFPDFAETSTMGVTEVIYTESEIESTRPLYDAFDAAVPLADYEDKTEEEQSAYYTHSLSVDVPWVVKLDYLFTNLSWTESHTLQFDGDGAPALVVNPMNLSDHCPIFSILELNGGQQ